MNIGQALDALERYEEALAIYEQALRLAPGNPYIYFKKGYTLKQLGRLNEAQQCYEKANQLKDEKTHE